MSASRPFSVLSKPAGIHHTCSSTYLISIATYPPGFVPFFMVAYLYFDYDKCFKVKKFENHCYRAQLGGVFYVKETSLFLNVMTLWFSFYAKIDSSAASIALGLSEYNCHHSRFWRAGNNKGEHKRESVWHWRWKAPLLNTDPSVFWPQNRQEVVGFCWKFLHDIFIVEHKKLALNRQCPLGTVLASSARQMLGGSTGGDHVGNTSEVQHCFVKRLKYPYLALQSFGTCYNLRAISNTAFKGRRKSHGCERLAADA